MEDELDQELIDLLKLEEGEKKPVPAVSKPEIEQKVVKEPKQIVQEPIVQEPVIEQVKSLPGPVEVELIKPEPVPEPIITLVTMTKEEPVPLNKTGPEEKIFASKEFLEKFVSVANSIVENHTIDRDQIEEAIIYFAEEVKQARELGLKLPPAMIDGWVKLLATKSDVNANATGVLDSMAKLLAAAKNNNLIININDKDSEFDLEAILSQPAKEDEK